MFVSLPPLRAKVDDEWAIVRENAHDPLASLVDQRETSCRWRMSGLDAKDETGSD